MDKINKDLMEQMQAVVSLAIRYAALWIPGLIFFLFLSLFAVPSIVKWAGLNKDIVAKKNSQVMAERNKIDIARMKNDLEKFKKKVEEFEKRLPRQIQTNLIIETLQQITEKSGVKFSSLEPVPIKKYTLTETNDVFVELPVRVKLNCSYYDLIDFLKKIETADQLMKIGDITIKDDPGSDWEHAIEFSISAFSKGDNVE